MWNNYTSANQSDINARQGLENQFGDFAKTGGYTPNDLSNIRGRANSPLAAVYANANREVDRSRALQGGYSPGFGVLKARMARDMSQGLSDSSRNTEGMIAQMVNQGKQFGTSGLLSAYGTAPGATGQAGQLALGSTGQRLQGEGLQQEQFRNQMAGRELVNKTPSNAAVLGGRLLGASQFGSNVAGTVYPWMGQGGGSGLLPSSSNMLAYQPGASTPNPRALGTPVR
jgi:hypothetical protein